MKSVYPFHEHSPLLTRSLGPSVIASDLEDLTRHTSTFSYSRGAILSRASVARGRWFGALQYNGNWCLH